MKRFLLIAAAIVALSVPGLGAQAHSSRVAITGTGNAFDPWGNPCQGCSVYIRNLNTGAVGSTVAYGQYSFSGLNGAQQYQTWINTCKVHSRLASPYSASFTGGAVPLPTLYANQSGAC